MISQSIPPEVAVRRGTHIQAPLSSELKQLLAEAEERVAAHSPVDSNPPSPEEEIEVLAQAANADDDARLGKIDAWREAIAPVGTGRERTEPAPLRAAREPVADASGQLELL